MKRKGIILSFFKVNKRGISLITLIITIIVILILTGAVVLTFVNNNPIDQANLVVIAQTKANIIDAVTLMEASNQIDIALGKDYEKITLETIAIAIGKTEDELVGYKLTEDGKLMYLDEVIYTLTTSGEEALSTVNPGDVAKVNSLYSDGVDIVTIPKGFKVSENNEEQTIADGVVIIDGDGNEYVWVPVLDMNEFYRKSFEYLDFSLNVNAISDSYTEDESTDEFKAMKSSVEQYGGFYIARYEAGVEGTSSSSVLEDGSVKPLSKADKTVWSMIPLDSDGDISNGTYSTGAVTVARSAYTGDDEYGVISTLCYGVQWDAVLTFLSDVKNPNASDETYITDSIGMGNYDGSLLSTGSSEDYKVNNIYDMAGNVYEWTMEENSFDGVRRGGNYGLTGSNHSISRRTKDTVSTSNASIGFRIALYIQ